MLKSTSYAPRSGDPPAPSTRTQYRWLPVAEMPERASGLGAGEASDDDAGVACPHRAEPHSLHAVAVVRVVVTHARQWRRPAGARAVEHAAHGVDVCVVRV